MIRQAFLILVGGVLVAALGVPAPLAAQTVATPSVQPPTGTRTIGTVVDISGAVVPDAEVVVTSTDGRTVTVRTDADGNFDAGLMASRVRVTSQGFETADVPVNGLVPMQIVLRPTNFADAVLVTATRGAERLPSAASSTALTAAELSSRAAGALDAALRATPGFTLFRRSSSRVANPTTQGVTLRGVSGSGASRTLVLADGIPLNDPFGSWVYWNRIPQAAVERVEIVRGASGDLYGADALGGVVQVLTFQPGRTRFRATGEAGSHDTARFSGFGGTSRGPWNVEGAGEWLRTDGVVTVGEEVRGPVDVRADSDYSTGFLGGGYNAGAWHATARLSLYDEERGNGTPIAVNTTDWTQVSAEAGGSIGDGAWLARASGGTQTYYQTFSAVLAGRTTERLTFEQSIPSSFTTATAQWTRGSAMRVWLLGVEAKRTESTVEELRYSVAG